MIVFLLQWEYFLLRKAVLGNIFAPVRRWGIFLLLCVAGEYFLLLCVAEEYFCSKKKRALLGNIFAPTQTHAIAKLFTFCTKKARTGHCVSKLRNFSLTPCDAQITCACPFLQKIPRTGKIYAQMIAKLFTFFTKKARTGYCVSKLRNFSLTPCDAPITCACPFLQKIPRTGVKYTHRWLLNFLRFLQKKARTGYCVSKLRNFSLTPCDAPITCACPFLQKIPRTGVKYTHRWLLNFLRFLQKKHAQVIAFLNCATFHSRHVTHNSPVRAHFYKKYHAQVKYTHRWLLNFLRFYKKSTHRSSLRF